MSAEFSDFIRGLLLVWAAIFLASLLGLYTLKKIAATNSAVDLQLRAHLDQKLLLSGLLTIALATALFGPPVLVNLLYVLGIGVPVALLVLGSPVLLRAVWRPR